MIANFKGITLMPGQTVEDLFEQVFKSHFKSLHSYACTIMREPLMAEEIVQNIFVKLWEKKEDITIRENISVYLYRAVHNESINYLRHLKVRSAYQSHAMRQNIQNEREKPAEKVVLGELEKKLEQALRELPEQCRTIFQLSRFEDLKYREIADRMGLSVKTIENQMGKALKILRLKLVDFLPIILFIISISWWSSLLGWSLAGQIIDHLH
jgi:RNA polymerase sigma-70 factor (ECF subfamily)